MLRKTFCLLAIAMLVIAASSAFGQTPTRITYFGDVEPNTPGSCGFSDGIFWSWAEPQGNTALGGVVADAAAIDGWAYRINDNSSLATDFLYWKSNTDGNHGSAIGATIVARVKTVSETDGSGNIGIRGSGLSSWYHLGDTHVVEPIRGALAPWTNDGAYHIIRLTAKGNMYVEPVPYTEDFNDFTNGNLSGQQGWGGAATTEVAIIGDDLTGRMVQVTGNGSETAAYLNMGADPDVTGKIYITVDAKLLTAGDIWCSYFRVYDRAGVNMANWMLHGYGDGSTVMGSIKGRVAQVATGLANLQLDADGSVCQMVIDVNADTCEYIVDGVSKGTLPCGTGNTGNNVGRIEIARFNDTRPGNPVCWWDNVDIQGTAVPVTGSRTIKLYMDENPTPLVTIENASGDANPPDAFWMGVGDDSGLALQDVSFDWVVGSSVAAFAPGEENAILGYALPLEDTVVTTIADCKTAPLSSQVQLTDAIISQSIYGNIGGGTTGQLALAIESADRSSGIRVMTNLETYAGATFNITGALSEINGERVIIPTYMFETGYIDPALAPVAMNNLASGGGAFGFQQGAVKDATTASGLTAYEEAFAYADGPLVGNDSWMDDLWTGTSGSAITVDTGALKILGGYEDASAARNVMVGSCGGKIIVTVKAKQGNGVSNFWYLRFQNAAGVNLAQWMGCGVQLVGRSDAGATAVGTLTGGWQTLKVEIDPAANTTEYFLDGASLGVLAEAEAGDALGKIVVFRYGRDNNTSAYVTLDDLAASPSPVMSAGLSNVGLYVTVFGKVTWVEDSLTDLWESYFYIDDGSGLKDGSGNIGIRCRPASYSLQLQGMPGIDTYVGVTGVMGIEQMNGVNCRYLRTWSYTDPLF